MTPNSFLQNEKALGTACKEGSPTSSHSSGRLESVFFWLFVQKKKLINYDLGDQLLVAIFVRITPVG